MAIARHSARTMRFPWCLVNQAAPPSAILRVCGIKSGFPAPPTPPAAVTETEDLLAVKCNLCNNTPLNPAGAQQNRLIHARRIVRQARLFALTQRNILQGSESTVGLIYRDQTHAIGRNIHKSDLSHRLFHIVGVLGILLLTIATFGRRENTHSMDDWRARG